MAAERPRSLLESLNPSARAAAWDPSAPQGSQFPGQRTVNDPYLNALRDAAVNFWAKRNVTVPANVAIDIASDLDAAGDPLSPKARAYDPTPENPAGRVVLNNALIGSDLRYARSERRPWAQRRDLLGSLATVLFHEFGHVGGLEHPADGKGLMGGEEVLPWDARAVIRDLIPRRAQYREVAGGGIRSG